jgi:uncharacterized membrane protein YeaQ/YmgE (transglycosylase-associated protein family)
MCRPVDITLVCPLQSGSSRAAVLVCEEELMFGVLGWILFGLVAGIIAKLVMPGRDPGGIIVTILLGIAGALLGGFIGRALGLYGANEGAGMLMSILGAVVLLALYRVMTRRSHVV